MDEVARYNQERWKALAEANALFSRPRLDLDTESARRLVDAEGFLGDLSGMNVLCLAGGGGKQSVAFALAGAKVTVVDLSAEQLDRDRETAEHYDVAISAVQADMRDLSGLQANSFDIVHHPYSINFVPDCAEVFAQVKRVLRNGGLYRFAFANPFTMSTRQDDWNGSGYGLLAPYTAGATITYEDQDWVYDRNAHATIQKPIEYRHNLSTIVNALISVGFTIRHLSDNLDMHSDPNADPGSWNHFTAYAPPWLCILACLEN